MDELMPEPTMWIECTECHAAWILRRCYQFTSEGLRPRWLWAPDCKCGKRKKDPAQPQMMTIDGPYETSVA